MKYRTRTRTRFNRQPIASPSLQTMDGNTPLTADSPSLATHVARVAAFIANGKSTLGSFWRSLVLEQKCYVLAFVWLIILTQIDFEHSNLLMYSPLLIVLVGLVSEFWPRFIKAWDSLPGKAFILFFYAVVANYALAGAASMVNEVTGVSATHLPYSHNFALMLSIPTLFFLTTTMALLVLQALTPVYLLLLLLLKPFGVNGLWHRKHYRYGFLTAMIRFMWSVVLLVAFAVGGVMSGFIHDNTPLLGVFKQGLIVGLNSNTNTTESVQDLSTLEADASLNVIESRRQSDPPVTDADSENLGDRAIKRSQQVQLMQHRLLANFVFNFEADSYSRCAFTPGSKVIELNDYQILTVTPVSDGVYDFNVRACESPGIVDANRHSGSN